jgi:hypothetical protein
MGGPQAGVCCCRSRWDRMRRARAPRRPTVPGCCLDRPVPLRHSPHPPSTPHNPTQPARRTDDAAPARHKVKLPASCGPGEAYSARESACLPCALGTFKAARGAKPCAPCPTGTTTDAEGGAAVSACSVCKPGHGAAGAFDPAAPECALCAPGTYRSGSGWAGCFPCPKGRVSRAVRCCRHAGAVASGGGQEHGVRAPACLAHGHAAAEAVDGPGLRKRGRRRGPLLTLCCELC